MSRRVERQQELKAEAADWENIRFHGNLFCQSFVVEFLEDKVCDTKVSGKIILHVRLRHYIFNCSMNTSFAL
jgi:hypothetical protein